MFSPVSTECLCVAVCSFLFAGCCVFLIWANLSRVGGCKPTNAYVCFYSSLPRCGTKENG